VFEVVSVVDVEHQRGPVVGDVVAKHEVDMWGESSGQRERTGEVQITTILALVKAIDAHGRHHEIHHAVPTKIQDLSGSVGSESQRPVRPRDLSTAFESYAYGATYT
jgi:hypothetical protein